MFVSMQKGSLGRREERTKRLIAGEMMEKKKRKKWEGELRLFLIRTLKQAQTRLATHKVIFDFISHPTILKI